MLMDGARASARTGVNGEARRKRGLFVHVCACMRVGMHKSVGDFFFFFSSQIFKSLFERSQFVFLYLHLCACLCIF